MQAFFKEVPQKSRNDNHAFILDRLCVWGKEEDAVQLSDSNLICKLDQIGPKWDKYGTF